MCIFDITANLTGVLVLAWLAYSAYFVNCFKTKRSILRAFWFADAVGCGLIYLCGFVGVILCHEVTTLEQVTALLKTPFFYVQWLPICTYLGAIYTLFQYSMSVVYNKNYPDDGPDFILIDIDKR